MFLAGTDSFFGIRLHHRAVAKRTFSIATDPTETIKDSNDNGMIGRHNNVGAWFMHPTHEAKIARAKGQSRILKIA
jgi:hypothetical protein